MTSCFTLYSELFHAVQSAEIFPDQKTFADAIPRLAPEAIDQAYLAEKSKPDFDLKAFVLAHFSLPEYVGGDVLRDDKNRMLPIQEYIENSWTILTRANVVKDICDTEIQLPSPFVVPGGRFREMFYWDSYFTALGLVKHKRYDLLFALANNCVYFIRQFGYIPNGSRTYFIGRSQVPVFILIVDLICRYVHRDAWRDYLPELETEYAWWMQTHAVQEQGHLLNRFYQAVPQPRPEAYLKDLHLVQDLSTDQQKVAFQHLRAACESGWDFSSRWNKDPHNMSTIRCADIAPVDLNCLLYLYERKFSQWYQHLLNKEKADTYMQKAKARAQAIRTLFYNPEHEFYTDYILQEGQSSQLTLAGLFPLYVGLATTQQAHHIIKIIQDKFLYSGGLVTTLFQSGQQWDYPNGWAPLQWIAAEAMRIYHADDLSQTIATRFCSLVESTYQSTGCILEKYNVVETQNKPQDGEYEVQTGFGWTNGVYMALQDHVSST